MSYKIFIFDKITVFFKHTDYYGFVHPYNYLEWMSYAREAYFQEIVNDFIYLCESQIKMVTSKTDFTLFSDAGFGDEIYVKIYAENVRRLSFDVLFEFFKKNDETLLGTGRQTLTFLEPDSGKLMKIPDSLKNSVLLFEKKKNNA